ncbi:rhomboid family intramembrane serine protease [Octadecabacter sp. 1_MG-2023]|uniref:rhomboid family intramembrane serine protease n=1 Tax=unclassified Octadecabacter TaxID=196158 RepID=UPI001C0A0832|nr:MULTISPECIES: rhomboid family intramembrane serine protease [unclassified Octadecabacter]MBU2993988.1 rhomboid family intramembrane serine protease [Octadecabacter sp. B2R22]MDO6736069.1 rhomboid family intramembrane serine protease [Octadecabacter sp. 1_MG-2023]
MAPLTRKDLRASWVLIAITVICVTIEAILSLSDYGLFGTSRLRQTTYAYGSFWPGILGNWTPNFSGQPVTMFITYGFLHAGPFHLIVNMFTLWSLGRPILERVGVIGFILLYGGSMIGGSLGYALLASGVQPMVGASGALFGLAGGLLAWAYLDRYTYKEGLWPIARAVGLLIALNIILWWAMNGQLAWQTHLGGFVVGWVMAFIVDPRPRAY